jgi:tetratricopeptide (TPR) repeat protein
LPDRAKAAHEASRKALRLAPNASPVEKALIEALQKRYSAVPPTGPDGQKALDTAFAGAMREASRRFPDDLDVATLSAEAMMNLRPWKLWTLDGKPEPGTLEILSTLERVMARDPSHPGANHYYIHAVEASPQPEKGLEAARRLPALVPGAGHIVHMPAHIYIRTGRYAETSEANRRAIRSEEAYAAAAKPSPMYKMMYIVHNYQFLWAATMMEGRSAESIRAARDSVRESSREMIRQMPGYDFLLTYPPLALLRFGRWEEVLKEPAPPEEFSFATAMWHHSRAVALAKLGRADEASAELKKLDAILTSTKPDAMQALNSAASLLTIASKVSAAQIATARGERARAVSLLEEAVSAEDRLNYNEPSDWYYPVRHTLGALLLSSGRPKEAEAVYRKDLERYPENGWSLYGLAQSLSAQKKAADAARVRKRFEAAWKNADVQIAGSEF